MPVAPVSTAELLELTRKSGILPPDRLALLKTCAPQLPPEPQKAAAVLVQKGVITKFQAQQLLQGRHKGFRLGAHAILDVLGRGGMGAVYLAEHLDLHRRVAIKVLVVGKDDDQRLAAERFMREARAAAALDHPNIVRIFDVARHNETPYLVMEYVDGETLQQTLDREGTLPYSTAVEYIAQAASGLQHAHEKGFVHRDIKPGNLIRDRSGTVKILDMGLARCFANDRDKLTEQLDAGAVVGTADFISPEQALNLPRIDIRADIYSLGATFFALIAGKPPFEGNTTQKLLHHQLTSAPHLSRVDSTLPKALAGVVAKMLAKKPEDRFQDPAEIITALAPWLGNSARVITGISRTKLAQGAELHAALSDPNRSGSRQLVKKVDPEAADLDPAESADDTGTVPVGETFRSPNGNSARGSTRKGKAGAAKTRSRFLLFAGIGVIVLAAGGVAGWIASDGKETASPPMSNVVQGPSTTPVAPDPASKADPAGMLPPVKGPAGTPPLQTTPSPAEHVAYKLDLSNQAPFTIRSGLVAGGNDQRQHRVISRSGAEPPKGWSGRCWNLESEIEFFAEEGRMGKALGIRNTKGPGSAMLFMPAFECPSGVCRIRFEYSAPLKAQRFALKYKPNDSRLAWTISNPPMTTEDVWRTEELVVDLKSPGGLFEFHNTDDTPAPLRLRSVVITELPAGTTPTTPPAPSTPSPKVDSFVGWKEGPSIYQLDVVKIPPFRITKDFTKRIAGEPEQLPAGVRCSCWKKDATGEFRREELDGVPVLGVTNLSEMHSSQFTFELEREMKLDLKPGKAYRVKVSYQTRNDAKGGASIQSIKYTPIATGSLTATKGQWKTATVSFVRPEDTPVRLTLDNNSLGEGNILYIRSVEIVELLEPASKN